jgi:hypothetical protein
LKKRKKKKKKKEEEEEGEEEEGEGEEGEEEARYSAVISHSVGQLCVCFSVVSAAMEINVFIKFPKFSVFVSKYPSIKETIALYTEPLYILTCTVYGVK